MANYYSLPNIYLGAGVEGQSVYDRVFTAAEANAADYASVNQFLKHLIVYALDHDKSLKSA